MPKARKPEDFHLPTEEPTVTAEGDGYIDDGILSYDESPLTESDGSLTPAGERHLDRMDAHLEAALASPTPYPTPPPSSQRNGAAASVPGTVIAREKLAINIADRERLEESVRVKVAKIVDASQPVWMDRNREDERAVVFCCDLLMAALACDVVREADLQAKRERTRVYVRKGAWSKVPGTMRLTVVVNGKPRLNPAVFNVEVVPIRMVAPKTKRFL